MQSIKTLLIILFTILSCWCKAQNSPSFDEVNTKSYALYEKASWKELLRYGKEAIAAGQDFSLLRMRLGYGAFILGNFSSAIQHYEAVLINDKYNAVARYYLMLCRRYLNQQGIADLHAKYISEEAMKAEKLHPIAITAVGLETSYKQTDITARDNSLYTRVDVSTRLGWHIQMQHSGAIYNQVIRESKFLFVQDNNNIKVNQKEYYNKTLLSLNRHWQIQGVYHYLHTPFNNYSYNNQVIGGGINYYNSYFDVKAGAYVSKLTDSTYKQYDLQLGLYPLGNLNLYFFSTGMLRSRNGSAFNFKQVVGFKLIDKLWVEGNGTFGQFSNLLENDALYVYNAIDKNLLKAGATAYFTVSPHWLVQAAYTYEKRELYLTSIRFNQHSITGGISWKF